MSNIKKTTEQELISEVVAVEDNTTVETNDIEEPTPIENNTVTIPASFGNTISINIGKVNWDALIRDINSVYRDQSIIRGILSDTLNSPDNETSEKAITDNKQTLTDFSKNLGINLPYNDSLYTDKETVMCMCFDIISVLDFFIRTCDVIRITNNANKEKELITNTLSKLLVKLTKTPVIIPAGQKLYCITSDKIKGLNCIEISVDDCDEPLNEVIKYTDGIKIYLCAEDEIAAITMANSKFKEN